MSANEFEKTLKFTKLALFMSGINISHEHGNTIKESFVNHCLFYCNFFVLYTAIFGEIYWIIDGILTNKPFVELSLISPCITIGILGTIKTWFLYINKEILVKVVDVLKEIHPKFDDNKEEFEIERKIVKESMKTFKIVQFLMISISVIVFTIFCFTPVLMMGYNYYKTGEFEIVYPFLVKYFFDVFKTSWWQLIYFHQVLATVIVIMNVIGSDTLFYALCVFITMHFSLLGLQFESAVSISKIVTKRNLAEAVKKHQTLIDLVNLAEILYAKSSLFNIITSSVLICLSAFNITVTDKMSTISAFISFLAMSLSQISLMCYFADMLMRSSMEISGSVYNCAWYEADEDCKKTILLVLMRSQKACRLTAWSFADLNLGAFTTILSRSWSYFALLKTVYK